MRRVAAVLVTPRPSPACPPGADPAEFALALAEDAYEVAAGLQLCEAALVVWGGGVLAERVRELTWPGTPVVTVHGPRPLQAALDALTGLGADQAVVLAADTPDLPPLLVGKLFRALGAAQVAVCPARGGGLAALAARLPAPHWIGATGLDDTDALAELTAARPERRALATTSGWHRLRHPDDLAALDPGLEGWESTRALLPVRHDGSHSSSSGGW